MEDFKEEEVKILVEEEDEVTDLCNVIIAYYWATTREIVQTYSCSVPTIPP